MHSGSANLARADGTNCTLIAYGKNLVSTDQSACVRVKNALTPGCTVTRSPV